MINIAVVGSTGKVGQEVVKLVENSSDMNAISVVRKGSDLFQQQQEPNRKMVALDENAFTDADVIIDFSTPDSCLELVDLLQGKNVPLVVGTTGFTEKQNKKLWSENKSYPILIGSNFTDGFESFAAAGLSLASTQNKASLTIGEVYHQHKKTEPSGTTQMLKQRYLRTAIDGKEREINLDIQRLGQTPGINTIKLDLGFSTIELSLTVHSRAAYASGAIKAARWLTDRDSGVYQPSDMII